MPEPRYARVFVHANGDVALFATRADGAFKALDGDLERERLFRLVQGLVSATDLGVQVCCAACPHVELQHGDPPGPCRACMCAEWTVP